MQLCKELVYRLGGKVTAARRCDFCVVVSLTSPSHQVSPSDTPNEMHGVPSKSQKSTPRRPEIRAGRLRLPEDAVIVCESWLIETLLSGLRQAPDKHGYKRA